MLGVGDKGVTLELNRRDNFGQYIRRRVKEVVEIQKTEKKNDNLEEGILDRYDYIHNTLNI